MGSNRFLGAAAAISQVTTLTVGGTAANGQTYSVTIGINSSKTVTYTATGTDTNTTIASGLQALLAASSYGEFQEITWTVATTVITATAGTAGKPFTLSTAASGTGTLVQATTTTSSGPSDWAVASNWSLNAVPVSTDDVYFDHSSTSALYNLNQSGVTLNSLTIDSTFTGNIGLPEQNTDNSTAYEEYRSTYLQIGATTVRIGQGAGTGSPRIKLNTGSVQTNLLVYQMASALENNLEALQWKGTHASNAVQVNRGTVAIGGYGGDLATVATLRVGFVDNVSGDAQVRCGSGCTLTTVNMEGGQLILNSAVTTINKYAGELWIYGSGAVTTLNENGGTTHYNSTGTLATANVQNGGTLDFSGDMQAKTVTNCNMAAGSSLSDPVDIVTFTNPVLPIGTPRLTDITLDVGRTWRVSQT